MRTIWRYGIDLRVVNIICMPADSTILSFQSQGGVLCIWAMVDPEEKRQVNRKFNIVGTGQNFDFKAAAYRGTVQEQGGALVWHLFEQLGV